MTVDSSIGEQLFNMMILSLVVFSSTVAAFWNNTDSALGTWSPTLIFPPGRSRHVAVPIGPSAVFVSGGLGDSGILADSWIYTVVPKGEGGGNWREVQLTGNPRPPCQDALAACIANRVYVFGGFNQERTSGPLINEMWVVDLDDESQFQIPRPIGPYPSPRAKGNALPVFENTSILLLFGSGRDMLTDMWLFNSTSLVWTNVTLSAGSSIPPPRERSCCASYNTSHILCFGGQVDDDLADLWMLDITTWTWTDLTIVEGVEDDNMPIARDSHQCFIDQANKNFIVAGGYSNTYMELLDIWAYSMDTRTWTKTDDGLSYPSLLIFDSAVSVKVGDRSLAIGGWGASMLNRVYEMQIPLYQWSEVQPHTVWPTARYDNCFVAIGPSFHLLFGRNEAGLLVDPWWTLSNATTTPSWSKVSSSTKLRPRAGATCTPFGTAIVAIFGTFTSSSSSSGVEATVEVFYPYATPPFTTSFSFAQGTAIPRARQHHGAAKWDQFIYVLGGTGSDGQSLSDVWRLDLYHARWQEIHPLPSTVPSDYYPGVSSPLPVSSMSFVTTATGILVMFGTWDGGNSMDIWNLNLKSATVSPVWQHVSWHSWDPLLGDYYVPRSRALVISMSADANSVFLMSGEQSPQDYRQNMQIINGTLVVGMNINEEDPVMYGACGGSAIGNSILKFGGLPLGKRRTLEGTPAAALQQYTFQDICAFGVSDAQGDCALCADGSVPPHCALCPQGTFFSPGSRLCEQCPPGTYGVDAGLVSDVACVPCPFGTYSPTSGATLCVPCPTTTTCPIGSSSLAIIDSSTTTTITSDNSGIGAAVRTQPADFATDPRMASVTIGLIAIGSVVGGFVVVLIVNSKRREYRRRSRFAHPDCQSALRKMFSIITLDTNELPREHLYGLCKALARPPNSSLPTEVTLYTLSFYFDMSGNNTVNIEELIELLIFLTESGTYAVDWEILGIDNVIAEELYSKTPLGSGAAAQAIRPERPLSLGSFDIFGDSHGSENDTSFKRSRKTMIGGACTIAFVALSLIITILFFATYYLDNTVETKSAVPRILLPIDVGSVSGQATVTLSLFGVPSGAACDCGTVSIVGSQLSYAERKRNCAYDSAAKICTIFVELRSLRLEATTSSILLTVDNSYVYANSLRVDVSCTTSNNDLSRVSGISVATAVDSSVVLRGMVTPTTVSLSFYPTSTVVGTVASPGYHVDVTDIATGSVASSTDFSTTLGLRVLLSITEIESSALIIAFQQQMTLLDLLSQISGSISGVTGVLIFFMTLLESLAAKIDEGVIAARMEEAEERENDKIRKHLYVPTADRSVLSKKTRIEESDRVSAAFPRARDEEKTTLALVLDGLPYRAAKRLACLIQDQGMEEENPTVEGQPCDPTKGTLVEPFASS